MSDMERIEWGRPSGRLLVQAVDRRDVEQQVTALEDRDTSWFVYGSLQLYGGIAQRFASAEEELLETIPA